MVWAAAALFLTGAAWAAPEKSAGRPHAPAKRTTSAAHAYTLDELIVLAEKNFPKVQEAQARLSIKKGQVWEARTAPYSEFKVDGGVGVAPTIRGTPVYSPSNDVALTKNMALAWQVGLEGLIPLWTFGKITSLWDAARANVELGRHEVERERNQVRLDVRRAFYGVLLARDSRILLNEATRRLDEHIAKLEADVAAGEGDDIELLKMKMQRAELSARGTEADKGERTALAGLRFYCGIEGAISIVDQPLTPIKHHLGSVVRYLEAARLHRPEVNMAKAGIAARRAQVELAKAKLYPDFGLGISAKVIHSAEVTDQRNPFARDPANRSSYGMGFVFRWKLNFLPQAAQLAQARAQLNEVRATERYALGGIAAEVEASYAEARAAKLRLDAWVEATNYAKQWMIKIQQGMDLGLSDPGEMLDPAKSYATNKASQMEALFDYNVALSKLSQATGWKGMLR